MDECGRDKCAGVTPGAVPGAMPGVAAELCERLGTKFFATENDLAWGRMLLERNAPGDAEKARDLLVKTQASAAACGYAHVERRATEALQPVD